MTGLILSTAEDRCSEMKLRVQEQTVRLTQITIAELFNATKKNISLHLNNIFEDEERDDGSVVKDSLTTPAGFNRPATPEKCSAVQKERT